MRVIDWLLEGDPAIGCQVLRDLGDGSPDDVQALRARVEHEGWGATPSRWNTLRALRVLSWWGGAACR